MLFNSCNFKNKFEYIVTPPGGNLPQVTRSSSGHHLARALSVATNLKFFSLRYRPKNPNGAGGDLASEHIASLFNMWRQRRPDNYQLLSWVKIEIPVYEHRWDFYSELLAAWELTTLSLKFKSRHNPKKQAAFFKKTAELEQIIAFGLSVQKNKTLQNLTFIADMPHEKKDPKELITFVRAIARNFILKKLKLHIDNTLGLKLYPWRLQVLAEFKEHPTLNHMKLFGTGPNILQTPCSAATPFEMGLYQLHYAMQLYQENKQRRLAEAASLLDVYQNLSADILEYDRLGFQLREGYKILANASFHELVVMASLYYKNIVRESTLKASLLKREELWQIFAQMTHKNVNSIALKDAFETVRGYLSEKDLATIFLMSGGLFHQLKKMIKVERPSLLETKTTPASSQALLFSSINCRTLSTLAPLPVKRNDFKKLAY